MLYKGLIIDSHCIKDARSKEAAAKSLTGWQQKEQSAEDWIHELEAGKTIVLAEMETTRGGVYNHSSDNFVRTFFVFADADNFKDDDNPNGIEPWTHDTGLSELYPNLKATAFAVGQSVSSMLKEPEHRRYRIIFKFDEAIETSKHYKQVLSKLAKEYPIITQAKRQPAQPVFGNAREGYNKFAICGNILKLADYTYKPHPQKTDPHTDSQLDLTVLDYIDCSNYDDWLTVGLVLFNEGKPCSVWDHWSSRSEKYEAGACEQKWATFGKSVYEVGAFGKSVSEVRWGTVVQMAKERGYQTQKHYVTDPPEPIPEPVRIDASDTSAIPFPVNALKNTVFGAYEAAYSDRNETCPAFRFAELTAVLGTALGRKVSLQSGRNPIYPNMYMCLVGPTGLARKSTSLKAAERLIEEIQTDTLQFINSLNTAEGLLKTMLDIDDCRTICILDEFKWLFSKSQNAVAAGLLPILNTLSGSPEIAMNRRAENPYEIIRPHFSFFSSITPGWFAENITRSTIGGGFVNRFVFFLHEQQPFFSDTEVIPPDPEKMKQIKTLIAAAAEERSTSHFIYDGETTNLDKAWYHERMQFLMNADEIVREASSRVDEHMKKICAMMAWCDNEPGDLEVHADTWHAAKAIAEYMIKVNMFLFKDLAVDKMTEQEMRVLKHLDDLGGKATKSNLSTKIGRQNLSSRDLERILQSLVANEIVGVFKEERTTFIVRIG